MTDVGTGIGASSLIAGTDMSTDEFSEVFEYDTTNVLSAASSRARAKSKDPLHATLSLDFDPSDDQDLKAFNSIKPKDFDHHSKPAPTDNRAAESPDSLHDDSFRDSSSDSCFSKRTGSSSSEKTTFSAGDIVMTDGPDVDQPWDLSVDFPGFQPPGCNDSFFFNSAAMTSSASAAPGALGGGDANHRQVTDDSFMNESFDFESASGSPEAINNVVPSSTHPLSPPNAPPNASADVQAKVVPNRVEDTAGNKHPTAVSRNKILPSFFFLSPLRMLLFLMSSAHAGF